MNRMTSRDDLIVGLERLAHEIEVADWPDDTQAQQLQRMMLLERAAEMLRTDGICPCKPVGQKQIAERLGLQRKSVNMARLRGTLPKPFGTVGRDPAWCWPHQIVPWAERTGRL